MNQHVIGSLRTYEIAGRLLLGLEPLRWLLQRSSTSCIGCCSSKMVEEQRRLASASRMKDSAIRAGTALRTRKEPTACLRKPSNAGCKTVTPRSPPTTARSLRLTLTWRGDQYQPAGLHLSEYFHHQRVGPSNKRSRSDEVSG